jgi:hypothetical protein
MLGEDTPPESWDVTSDYSVIDPLNSPFKVISATTTKQGDRVEIKIGLKDDNQTLPAVSADFLVAGEVVPVTDTLADYSFISIKLRPPATISKKITFIQTNDALKPFYSERIWLKEELELGDGSVHSGGPVFIKIKNYIGQLPASDPLPRPDEEPTDYLIAKNSPTHKIEVVIRYEDVIKTFIIDYSAVKW